jgi:flagellin-like hook-associated protein FlgL
MRIKTTLKEMKNADVRFISLVTRGANRIPFRIIKSDKESGMIDLGNIKRVLKGEKVTPKSQAPEVVAVVVMDHGEDTLEGVKKALADNGLPFDKATKNEDGTVVLSSGDLPADAHIVRLSEDMAVVMKDFSPYSEELSNSTDFNEVMAAQGYYQGIRTACDAVVSTISNILYNADSGVDASSKVGDVLSKFSTYVTTLTKGLPTSAFKAEVAVAEVVKSAKDKTKNKSNGMACPEGVDPKKWAEMSDAEKKACKDKAKKEDGQGAEEGATAGEGSVSDVNAEGEGAAGSEKTDESGAALKAVMEQLSTLSEAVKGVSGEVAKVAKSQNDLSGRVDEIARKAETATQVVKSTVVAGAVAGDEPAQSQQVKKSGDSDPRTGCFDTGFMRRR